MAAQKTVEFEGFVSGVNTKATKEGQVTTITLQATDVPHSQLAKFIGHGAEISLAQLQAAFPIAE